MPQWSLAKSLPEVARGNRPPKIKEKLEAASAVKAAPTPEIRLQQPAEVRRLMVQEASRALATMPDRRSGNSPNAQNRNDANREQNSNRLVAPRPATELVRPNASLPPVQQKLPVAAANPPASTVSPVQNRAPMVTQGNAVPLPSRPSNGNRQAAVPGQTGRPLPGAGTSGNVRRPDAELTVSPQNLRENNRSGAAQIVPSRPAVTQNNAVPQPAVNPQIPAQSVPPAPAYNNQASLVEVLRQRQEAAAQFEQQRRDSIQNEGRNGAGNRDGVENNNGPMSAQDLAARTQQEAQKANAAQSAQGLTGNASQQGINGTAPLQNEAVSSQNPLQQQLLARQAAEREHQARLRQNSEDATRLQQQQQQQLAADNASRQEQAQSQEENSRRRASQMQSENQARAAAESSRLLQQQQQAAAENSRQQAAAQAQQAAQASAAAHAAQQQAQAQAQAAAQSQAATRRSNEDAQRAASDQQRRAQEEQAKRR
jgi:hypothetical protein